MKKRVLTCIVCPRGCTLEVEFAEDGGILGVTGNACKRGVTYATDECTHPKRTVTSTARTTDGATVAVKTSGTVPKERVFDVMAEINKLRVDSDARIGDVVIKDVLGLGADVIVTGAKSF